jgi:hypothetical protein
MKFLSAFLSLAALLSKTAKACQYDLPNILLSVEFAEGNALGPQQSTEFLVPLYSDCEYSIPAGPVQAGGMYEHRFYSE